MKMKLTLAGAALIGMAISTLSAWTADTNASKHLTCVPIQNIQGSPAIDSRTILLELNGHKYKRIDLANNCSGVTFKGFSFDTSTQDLCVTNTLHVNEVAGANCMIKDIVDITPEEAKALRMKK
jgi:hypothetical protein